VIVRYHGFAALLVTLGGAAFVLILPTAMVNAQDTNPSLQRAPLRSGCITGSKRPDLSALPAGTRVYYDPVLTITHRTPAVAVQEMVYSGAHRGDVRADIRNDAIYVQGKDAPAVTLDGQTVTVRSQLRVCVYPPGEVLPPELSAITPDLVLR
jgi:hypothetical protein